MVTLATAFENNYSLHCRQSNRMRNQRETENLLTFVKLKLPTK